MPSDPRIAPALAALRAPIDAFRAAVGAVLAQATDHLDAHRVPVGVEAAAASLGKFAAGRLDTGRFAAVFGGSRVLGAADVARLERCRTALADLLAEGDRLYVVELAAGTNLEDAVDAAYTRIGRAFGAALSFQAVRAGVYREETHASLADGVPFAAWNPAERLLAPPLVVSVDGADVDAARIARFVDGRARIVLLVRGTPAPAALVSLVTPGVLVVQTDDAAEVARLATSRAAGVLAVVPSTAARFAHDPGLGPRLCDRLTIVALPADVPRKASGRSSAAQLGEQLAQLRALAAAAQAERAQDADRAIAMTQEIAAAASRADVPAVDALAGWLLAQAGLAGAKETAR